MNPAHLLIDPRAIVYPESDGQPMSDNTRQFRWIMVLAGNIAALFRDVEDVFVSGNQFWYPEEGHPEIVTSPDVYAVFGRPKGDRPSYLQWKEGDVPLTVVFEILSPKNTYIEMADKLAFNEQYGVEEFYIYDPETNQLAAYLRKGEVFRRVRPVHGFISPRLGIRFDMSGPEMMVYRPDGQPFLTFEQLTDERDKEQKRRIEAEQQADQARQQADQARQQADQARQQVSRIAALSRKARHGKATPGELAELDQLEGQSLSP